MQSHGRTLGKQAKDTTTQSHIRTRHPIYCQNSEQIHPPDIGQNRNQRINPTSQRDYSQRNSRRATTKALQHSKYTV